MRNYPKNFKVFGVGINDADYNVSIKSLNWSCPYYNRWRDMLRRCYYGDKYEDCSVSPEWLVFSKFKSWMEKQDWEGKQLDKDLLGTGHLYSEEYCIFLPNNVNTFIAVNSKTSKYLIGVGWHKRDKKFYAQCNNPIVKYESGRSDNQFLGYYKTEIEAHQAWQAKKYEYAIQLADLQDDIRIAEALRKRFHPEIDLTTR